MHAAIYRTRHHGVRLTRPQPAVVGQLLLKRHAVGSRNPDALLAEIVNDEGSSLVPPLHEARVSRITREGLAITGTELVGRDTAKARVRPYPQVWWCLLLSDAALRRLAGTHLALSEGLHPRP